MRDWLYQIIRFAEYTQIDQRLVIVWDNGLGYVDVSIVHGLALGWGISQGLADWHWIGRLVLDWPMSQSLPLD